MNIVTAMFHRTVAMTCAPISVWITTDDRVELLEWASDVDWATSDVSIGAKSLIRIEPDLHFQEMFGFGAALTDASARAPRKQMSKEQRAAPLQQMFCASRLAPDL
ncbi:hypothetical protein [Massilia rhizosphaerae]|uniref:hypothetical protein n=1 Tax=Massilia rhizosphaerae TaxID=2784389 RepID=UPI0018DD2DF5|nr:hypothetical protein [Massilia rhizosphaerae]